MLGKGSVKLLLESNRSPSRTAHRSEQQIELLVELCRNSRILEQLALPKNSLSQICDAMVLIWADNPHSCDLAPNQVYLLLQGKAFEYLHNSSQVLKSALNHTHEYLMVRKLLPNDYFIAYAPGGSLDDHSSHKKYQLMIDQGTLVAKIDGEVFQKYFAGLIEERWKKMLGFLRRISMFESLPLMLLYQVSKYLKVVNYNPGAEVISRGVRNHYVYFIIEGEIDYKIYDTALTKSQTKVHPNLAKPTRRVILKQHEVFGIDSFHEQTLQELSMEYRATCRNRCLLYKIDKRILAIVISSFDGLLGRTFKAFSSVNINEQIQGQYQTADMAQLSRNADRIRSSEKRIRDIKLRAYGTSHRNRADLAIMEMEKKEQDMGITDFNYRSCDNFNAGKKQSKDMKLYQSVHNKIDTPELVPRMQLSASGSRTMISNYVLSTYDDLRHGIEISTKPNIVSQATKTSRSSFMVKRKSEAVLPSGGKQESDIIRSYLQRKLKDQMLKKAEIILQRNQQRPTKETSRLKRLFNHKSVRSLSTQQGQTRVREKQKEVNEQLYETMNRLAENPLLSLIESERKRMERQAAQIKENKQKSGKKTIKADGKSTVNGISVNSSPKKLVLIQNF